MSRFDLNVPSIEEFMYGKKKAKSTKRKKLSRAVEKAIFEKYAGICAICGKKTELDYGEVDHIRSLKKGGSATAPSNLQWLCHRCNKLKGANRTNSEVKKLLGKESSIKSKKTTTKKSTSKKKTTKKSPFEIELPKIDLPRIR
jgi:5-methylcytosine-specific restriction endonuclease McrA